MTRNQMKKKKQTKYPRWEHFVTDNWTKVVRLGKDGWELVAVSVVPITDSLGDPDTNEWFYLKRLINQPKQ